MPLLNRAVATFGASGMGIGRGAAAAAGSTRRPAISLSSNLRPSPGGWAEERVGSAWKEPRGGGVMLATPIFGADRGAMRMEEGDWWRRVGGRGDGRRAFFGVGDATIHEERRLIQHSPEELFDVVSSSTSPPAPPPAPPPPPPNSTASLLHAANFQSSLAGHGQSAPEMGALASAVKIGATCSRTSSFATAPCALFEQRRARSKHQFRV